MTPHSGAYQMNEGEAEVSLWWKEETVLDILLHNEVSAFLIPVRWKFKRFYTLFQTVFFYSWLWMMSLRADIPDRVITGTDLAVRTEAPPTCCLNVLHRGAANQKKVAWKRELKQLVSDTWWAEPQRKRNRVCFERGTMQSLPIRLQE